MGFVGCIGSCFAVDKLVQIVCHGHMAAGTTVLLFVYPIGNFSVEFVVKVTFGMVGALELFIDLLMTLFAGVVVKIGGFCQELNRKEQDKRKDRLHCNDFVLDFS